MKRSERKRDKMMSLNTYYKNIYTTNYIEHLDKTHKHLCICVDANCNEHPCEHAYVFYCAFLLLFFVVVVEVCDFVCFVRESLCGLEFCMTIFN